METTTPTTQSTPTTQNPPAAQPERSETESKRSLVPERDFRTQLSRTGSPGFRVGLAIGVIVLLVAGIFIYRYLCSYESTDDAQVDRHVNSVCTRVARLVGRSTVLNTSC